MPHHELKTLEGGKIEVTLETGEKFSGDPLEVTAKLADSKVETRRHYEGLATTAQAEVERLKTQPAPVVQPQTPTEVQEKQWQDYIVEQTAKGLGYENAEQFKTDLSKVKGVTAEVENQAVAANFLQSCQDFPNTPEAIEALSKKIDDNKWDFSPQSMIAAHTMCVRENQYKALTPDEINQTWANNMQAATTRSSPPPMIRSNNPEGNSSANDPWSMPLDNLRKAALAQK